MFSFMLVADRSGSGKTLLSAAVIRAIARRGLKIRPYKCGPDYLDRIWLTQAASVGQEENKTDAYNLDPVITGENFVKDTYSQQSEGMDGAVIEGVMGFFDGLNPVTFEGSSWHVAKLTRTPAVLVLDAKSLAASSAAIIKGMQILAGDVGIAGVILNRVSSSRQENILRTAIEGHTGARIYGSIPILGSLVVPSRHLGLKILSGIEYDRYFEQVDIEKYIDLDNLMSDTPATPNTAAAIQRTPPRKKAYIAYDEAFFCYYPTTIDLLESEGFSIEYFSPLNNDTFDGADLIIIGGGYPELFTERLGAANSTKQAVLSHHKRGVPVFAECGGFIYLSKTLDNTPMAGLFDVDIEMSSKLQRLGYVQADNGMRGHMFHYSRISRSGEKPGSVTRLSTGEESPDGYGTGSAYGGYTHYMPTKNDRVFIDFIHGRAP